VGNGEFGPFVGVEEESGVRRRGREEGIYHKCVGFHQSSMAVATAAEL